MASEFTASGARRTGDEYQDLVAIEILVEWLEHPDRYQWVRFETREGALDDVEAMRSDGSLVLRQVKFATAPDAAWTWDDLTEQKTGKRGAKPSLLQKWCNTFHDRSGTVSVNEAALWTNREADPELAAVLAVDGRVLHEKLPAKRATALEAHLGGHERTVAFFAEFQFRFDLPSPADLEAGVMERFVRRGGTQGGWENLLRAVRRWINRTNEPSSGGRILLEDVEREAQWRRLVEISQRFSIPFDYVPPPDDFRTHVRACLKSNGDSAVVITGPPGIGKSTFLSHFVGKLKAADVPVIRHHFYLSVEDRTAGRTEWEVAVGSLVAQLVQSYGDLLGEDRSRNPDPSVLHQWLEVAGQKASEVDRVLVVVIDGLDHVWRDHKDPSSAHDSLRHLFEALLPPPSGVVVFVGTQDVDDAKIPRRLLDACPRCDWLRLPPLGREGVREWVAFHDAELGIEPDADETRLNRVQWQDAFNEVSGGHPLHLQYTLSNLLNISRARTPDAILELPRCERGADIHTYYERLWQNVEVEGRQLLHLLAEYAWPWPRDGLVRCLSDSGGDLGRLWNADGQVRHLLGKTYLGVTAFHESLLVFLRLLPEHRDAIIALRPRVVSWLRDSAPEEWRWAHLWDAMADGGDAGPLLSGPSLDWAVDAIAEGRVADDIVRLLVRSEWTALEREVLGRATELQLLEAYVREATSHHEEVIARLLWTRLQRPGSADSLRRHVGRCGKMPPCQLEVLSELAAVQGMDDLCIEIDAEMTSRWNHLIAQQETTHWADFSGLSGAMPAVIAASCHLKESEGPFLAEVQRTGKAPSWCSPRSYAEALARLAASGQQPSRKRLKQLANISLDGRSIETAVEEVVRLACSDGFDPHHWVTEAVSMRSGLFRTYRAWIKKKPLKDDDGPTEPPFDVLDELYTPPEVLTVFSHQARRLFFATMAHRLEGREGTLEIPSLNAEAHFVREFLNRVVEVAAEAASAVTASNHPGFSWCFEQFKDLEPPRPLPSAVHDRWVGPPHAADAVREIADDLASLAHAAGRPTRISLEDLVRANDSPWWSPTGWLENYVARRCPHLDDECVDHLLAKQEEHLRTAIQPSGQRAEAYARLAQLCALHHRHERARELSGLAARNLLGVGFHKDMTLYDVLEGIRICPMPDRGAALNMCRSLAPVVDNIGELTDGDETWDLPQNLAGVLAEVYPERLPACVAYLQHEEQFSNAEGALTRYAKRGSLESLYGAALARTIVHEEGLQALEDRALQGDEDAGVALHDLASYLGRALPLRRPQESANPSLPYSSGEEDIQPPAPQDYPPERFGEFVIHLRDAGVFLQDEDVVAWFDHWDTVGHEESVLAAVDDYYRRHDRLPSTKLCRRLVDLVVQVEGRPAAWTWLVRTHREMLGWTWFAYSYSSIGWVWEAVNEWFPGRWLEFIRETAQPRWREVGHGPQWSMQRLIRYLVANGKNEVAVDVLGAAVDWAAGLTGTLQLDPPAWTDAVDSEEPQLDLLVGRLESPSRMVHERAAQQLAILMAAEETRPAVASRLRGRIKCAELEDVVVEALLVFLGANAKNEGCAEAEVPPIADTGAPSMLAGEMLRVLAPSHHADPLLMLNRHSGSPPDGFAPSQKFEEAVRGHLAPIYLEQWAKGMDDRVAFTQQWAWETEQLAAFEGLTVTGVQPGYVARGQTDPMLPVSTRLSAVLRSAYHRTLAWAIEHGMPESLALLLAYKACPADPAIWQISPIECPAWWPIAASAATDQLDDLPDRIGAVVRSWWTERDREKDTVIYAAGPIGLPEEASTELRIVGFFQRCEGPEHPDHEELEESLYRFARRTNPGILTQGSYSLGSSAASSNVGDWTVTPTACSLDNTVVNWWMPMLEQRGIWVPAPCVVGDASPQLNPRQDHLEITADEEPVGSWFYWHDEVTERIQRGTASRAGAILTVPRSTIEDAEVRLRARFCWLASSSTAYRPARYEPYGYPETVLRLVLGSSSVVMP